MGVLIIDINPGLLKLCILFLRPSKAFDWFDVIGLQSPFVAAFFNGLHQDFARLSEKGSLVLDEARRNAITLKFIDRAMDARADHPQ